MDAISAILGFLLMLLEAMDRLFNPIVAHLGGFGVFTALLLGAIALIQAHRGFDRAEALEERMKELEEKLEELGHPAEDIEDDEW